MNKISADRFAVIDFETTGLNPNTGDRVIEIGVSMLEGGVEVDTFATLINPGMPIPRFITELTGISTQMVKSAPSASVAFQAAWDFVGDARLVAHNASFDRKFWQYELSRVLNINCNRDFICTLMLSRRILQAYSSHKLGMLAMRLNIDVKESHRALDDAQVTSRLLAILIERLSVQSPQDHIDIDYLLAYQKKPKAKLPDLTRIATAAALAHQQCY